MRSSLRRSILFLFLAALFLASGCAKRAVTLSRPAPPYSRYQRPQAAFTDAEQALVDKNCPDGLPQTKKGFDFGPTQFVFRDEYVLQHASSIKIALFVCEGLTKTQLSGPGDRSKSKFQADPALGDSPKATDADYKGYKNEYDRGHMAPAANHKNSQQAMDDTHYLSNVVPQASSMNQHIWQALEDMTRKWVDKYENVYELTGGFFYDPDEDDPHKADGLINYYTIGNGVAVPTHIFKIVVAKFPDGKKRVLAFAMENKSYPTKGPWNFDQYIKPVQWIEDRAGLKFMPKLEPEEEAELKTKPGKLSDWQ